MINSAASLALNKYGSKVTNKLPSSIRNAAGFALNFRRFKEPHLSYKWEFLLPKLNFKSIPESSELGDYVPTVLGCSVPFSSMETEEIYINTNQYKLPTYSRTGDLTIRVLHELDGKALFYFECWKASIKDKMGRYQYPSVYKKNLYCKLLNLEGGDLNVIKLSGCFPKDISISLAYDSSEVTTFDVTLSVDFTPLMELKTNLLSINNLKAKATDVLKKVGNFNF